MVLDVDLLIVGGGFTGIGTAAGFRCATANALPGTSKFATATVPAFVVLESGDIFGGFWLSQVGLAFAVCMVY